MRVLAVFFALVLLGASAAATAMERGDVRALARMAYARAEEAAQARRFAEARAAYREAIALDPSAPFAVVARARAEDIEAHSEGGFAPLARLSEAQRDPTTLGSRADVEALERDLKGFPDGRVRSEARLLVAEAWSHRFRDPARAEPVLEAAVADSSADHLTRALALSELCTIVRARGDLHAALRAVERDPELSPSLTLDIRRLARRERLRSVAEGVVAFLAVVGAASMVRLALRARRLRDVLDQVVSQVAIAAALYVGGAGAVLCFLHGGGDPRPFLVLGVAIAAIDVIARATRLSWRRSSARLRATWALACMAGVVAAAFLAVEQIEVSYLEGLGL